ncbi:MAG: hypothetical protein LBI05_11205 [Planctomycetaceae bacterium]|nr:hypothetical protein [Planctomycetaceae bacterium]
MIRRVIFWGFIAAFCAFVSAQELTEKQRGLAGRYAQLEQILLRLVETSGSSNPQQATLLKKALLESKDKLLIQRFDRLVSALERRQFSDAVTGQTEMEQDLLLLLKLLESMSRDERREQEKEKIKEFLKEVEEILQSERILKNQTHQQESPNLPTLEKDQRDIRMRVQSLRDRVAENEGQESGDRSQEESASTPQTPSQRAMQRALKRMKQAEQKLQQAEKEGAIEEQEEAIAELQKLKDELEKILRQLREEELMQTLEKLEARFKRMFQQEQTIRSQTERLIQEAAGESAPDQRQTKIRTDRLGIDQQAVIDDAESALLLLREDGSAQAMVESLLQARFDMTEVKKRLEISSLDSITLHIEDAVIEALQEMLDAVRAAMEESKERQENAESQQQQDGSATEEPLIQLLAELRMIRSMQRRVNERTSRYDQEIKQMLTNPDADLSTFKQAVEELARQQNRLARILHELN